MKTPSILAAAVLLAAAVPLARAAAVEFETVRAEKVFTDIESDTAFGFSIQVPKGSEVQQQTRAGHIYYKPVSSLSGYLVKVLPVGSDPGKSAEKATAYVKMMAAGSTVKETRKDASGFVVVLAPMGVDQEVWTFRDGKGAHAHAVCSGPASALATLEALCGSLQLLP